MATEPCQCYGCSEQISIGDEVRQMNRFELDDETNYELLGYLCPACSGLYDSLIELGFCLTAERGFIKEAMCEYRTEYLELKEK